MGKEQSKLAQEGYVTQKETESYTIVTKDDDTFFIKIFSLKEIPKQAHAPLFSEIEILQNTNHPHIVNVKNLIKDENKEMYYLVMDHYQGGNLADELGKMPTEPLQESEVLSWMTEICMALKTIHEADLLHKDLRPKNILLTEFGIVRLGGFGSIHENSNSPSTTSLNAAINYLAPEVFAGGSYDAKSDIWSLGCLLYELCTKQPAFFAESAVKLIQKITIGNYSLLPPTFSFELCDLVSDLLKKDPRERPTADEILAHPIILKCLINKCKTTVDDLQTKLEALRALADGLEGVHEKMTIGSLAGGVIGAVGGITSIVGLALAPFTLGASLVVTGIGVGVGAFGGVTAGASNITNMVKQSSERRAIRSMIKEFEQKMSAVVTWLLEINNSLQTIKSKCPQTSDTDSSFREDLLKKIGFRAGRNLSGVTEFIRLASVASMGKIGAQTSRVVRVAEVATGVLSGLFVAVDIFFIAMDAKEIHHIKEARGVEKKEAPSSGSQSGADDAVSASASDTAETEPQAQNQTSPRKAEVKSEVMRFIQSVREAADNLENVLTELKSIVSSISLTPEENDLEWQDMES